MKRKIIIKKRIKLLPSGMKFIDYEYKKKRFNTLGEVKTYIKERTRPKKRGKR